MNSLLLWKRDKNGADLCYMRFSMTHPSAPQIRLFQNPSNTIFTNYWIRRTTVCLGMRSISWALHKISLALSYHRCSHSATTFTPEVVSKYQAHCGARGQLPNYRGVRSWSSMPCFWSVTCGSVKCTGACKKYTKILRKKCASSTCWRE